MTEIASNVDDFTASLIAERDTREAQEEAAQAKADAAAVDELAGKIAALQSKKNKSASDELMLALVKQNADLQQQMAKMVQKPEDPKFWSAGPGPGTTTKMDRVVKQWDEAMNQWVPRKVTTVRKEM